VPSTRVLDDVAFAHRLGWLRRALPGVRLDEPVASLTTG